jgi:type I restriction enzyme, S subunit
MIEDSEIPDSWLQISLGEIVEYGKTNKTEPTEIPDDAWILELEDIEKDTSKLLQRLTLAQRQSKSTKNRFNRGDVLYGKLRPYLNKILIADADGYCTTEIIPLKSNLGLDERFLFYWLKHPIFLNYVESVSHGLTMPRLGTEAGRQAPFILAPLNEQKRIADKLDRLLAKVDNCRERLDRIPLLLKRFRQSVLTAAVSGQLTENWRDINQIVKPTNVDLSKIINKLKTGPFGSTLHKSDYVHNGIPIVNPMHINSGSITPSIGMSISEEKAEDLREYRLKQGDIVFARRGVMGRCAVVTKKEQDWLCGSGSMIIRMNDLVIPAYVQMALSSPSIVTSLEDNAVGSTMVNLNQKILLGLQIFLPVIDEQQEIIRQVEKLFDFADRLEARYQTARAQIDKLTPALLDKAFKGELVPQDPTDEPAETLLQKISKPQKTKASSKKKS